MSICWAGLLPHPPIIVPAVGGQRRNAASQTIAACETLAVDLMAHRPDRLILISPHTPRPKQGICTWETPSIRGDFSQFGAPNCQLEVPNDLSWLSQFNQRFSQIQLLNQQSLDHGASVPLYFLVEAGWSGPTVVLGLPWSTQKMLETIAHALKEASNQNQRTAILASGDMSHCLLQDGPYGFHPQGPEFDEQFVAAIRKGVYQTAAAIDESIREPAKEDVLDSSLIAWHTTDFSHRGAQFLSYEGPFGVGYSVMRFYGDSP